MKKGDIIENIMVESMAAEGKCVARLDGQVLFLKGCAPGDAVDARITKVKSSFMEGIVTRIVNDSPTRTQPFCMHFGTCGGCSWQHIHYDTQLFYKQQQVIDNLERLGGLSLPPVQPIVPSGKTKYYRNRLDYTFTNKRWIPMEEFEKGMPFEPGLGFHMPGKFDLVFDVKECFLQAEPSNNIRLATRDEALKRAIPMFDLRRQTGFLRTITIRTTSTGEVMIILQVTEGNHDWIDKILGRLENDFPAITSFNYIINAKRNDSFQDLDVVCWKGHPYITEVMPKPDGSGSLQFRIGPKSFYQTNSEQAYQLYKITNDLAAIQKHEVVYDLYTGTGTIANFVASQAKKVIGLEYVADAIEDAHVNSQLNDITNTDFFAGDMKDILTDDFINTHGKPDVIITDPPRGGMHDDVCKMILKAAPDRVVYVSCNPATQARDLKILCEQYTIEAVQAVDMFPHTTHVENVVLLKRKAL